MRDGRWDHALGQRPSAHPQAGVMHFLQAPCPSASPSGRSGPGSRQARHPPGSPTVDTALAPGRGGAAAVLGAQGQAGHPDAGGDVAPVPQVARQSLTMFILIMNGGHIEIDAHRLNDGGLLLSYDGNSYTTYMKEEVDRCVGGAPKGLGGLSARKGFHPLLPNWLLIYLW